MNSKILISIAALIIAIGIGCQTSQQGSSDGEKKEATYEDVMKGARWDQTACSTKNFQLNPADAAKFMKIQNDETKLPEGGKFMGDHANGKKLFEKSDKGNCYACHCGENNGEACGSVAPSLSKYAKMGTKPDFVYKKIYNGWSIVPCSSMPRFGLHGVLKPAEISDIVAYLLDPASSLNK